LEELVEVDGDYSWDYRSQRDKSPDSLVVKSSQSLDASLKWRNPGFEPSEGD
jgi:hypothetical protein